MPQTYNISFIGSGQLCRHLSHHLEMVGHSIQGVYHHNEIPEFINSDFLFLTVPDKDIEFVAKQVKTDTAIVVHVAGSMSMELLSHFKNHAVCWPCNSFAGLDFFSLRDTVLFIESNTDEVRVQIYELFSMIFDRIVQLEEKQRMKMHLVATVMNNFSTHLFDLAEQYATKHGLDAKWAYPMIIQQLDNLKRFSAHSLQSGAAKRGDLLTIEKHRRLLSEDLSLLSIYNMISESIIKNQSS